MIDAELWIGPAPPDDASIDEVMAWLAGEDLPDDDALEAQGDD